MSPAASPSKLLHPAEDFIARQLPGWLKAATPQQLARLQSCLKAHLASQKQMASVASRLLPLDGFARQRLESALSQDSQLHLKVDLDKLEWREERARLEVSLGVLPDYQSYFVRVPALQKLLQNFKAGESFFQGTALTCPKGEQPEQVVSGDVDRLVSLCRQVDVGAAYQRHLGEVMSTGFSQALAKDKRLALAVALEVAAIKKQLMANDVHMLRQLCRGQQPTFGHPLQLRGGALQVLGCQVDGALAFELIVPARSQSTFPFGDPERLKQVVLYLPDDHAQPLRVFANWNEANRVLATGLADKAYRAAFARRIALNDRAQYERGLANRLQDKQPDLEPRRVRATGDVFALSAAWHIQRVKADAGFLAVPTSQADGKASAQRLRDLESTGLVLLNLAGLFVPAIGAVLLADLGRHLLSDVFEGVRDWQSGHQHEALQHMLQVAVSLATTGAIVMGTHLARSAFVEALEPVTTEDGRARLWRNDLQPYQADPLPAEVAETDNGLLTDGKRHWLRLEQALYGVRQDARGGWRLRHASDHEAYGPVVRSNAERAWLLGGERPLEWQGAALLLGRLWPSARTVSAGRVAQMLSVADVDEEYLRGLLVERRRLPVQLRDTLERFAVDARMEAFFAQLEAGDADTELWQWCIDHLQLQGQPLDEQVISIRQEAARVREAMFEHFSSRYLVKDPLQALIQRDFPALPDAYALDALDHATAAMRLRMQAESRIPLALAERLRATLQLARLTRMREALYLPHSYRPELVALVFALLRLHGPAAADFNLVLRQDRYAGQALAQLFPERGMKQELVLVRRSGGFQLYAGSLAYEREIAEPQGLFEVLAACLPDTYRSHPGWAGADAPAAIRRQMQAWLPDERGPLLRLLGWREARPQASTMQRMEDGRAGYLLGGCQSCISSPDRVLRQRVRALYPGIGDEGTEHYIQALLLQPGTVYDNLLRAEQEYRQLEGRLHAWARETPGNPRARQQVADSLCRAWQMRSDRFSRSIDHHAMLSVSIVAAPVGSLPALPAGTDFSHVSELTLAGLELSDVPRGFLACFPRLRRLDLSNNALTELPPGLERLTELRQLLMPRNRIRIPADRVSVLAHLSNLRSLDLSSNFLGGINLQFNQLSGLRFLRLNNARLLALPPGLQWCGLLVFADLRNNQIANLPDALFQAPLQLRRALQLDGNVLPAGTLERLYTVERLLVTPRLERRDPVRDLWLGTLGPLKQQAHATVWDALVAEPDSRELFDLLANLTGTAEFRKTPTEIGRRVWTVLQACHDNTATRMALFHLAAEPTTCVDSVATTFSRVEVRMHVEQAIHGGGPLVTRVARLQLAKRLFRVHLVEKIARRDMEARYNDGRWARGERDEEEVEVNLAYLSRLAQRLDLLGQPRYMQFENFAQVSASQIDDAYTEVLQTEMTAQRTIFISQLDFWVDVLRAEQPDDFDEADDHYSTLMAALEEHKNVLSSEQYMRQANSLRDERDRALGNLAQRLTVAAMQTP